MKAAQNYTPLQKVARLITNIAPEQRGGVFGFLRGEPWASNDAYFNSVADACHDALTPCDAEERCHVLRFVPQVAELLDEEREKFLLRASNAELVATFPDFLYDMRQGALPPVNKGSLERGMVEVVQSARHTLEITIPYISRAGVYILTRGLTRNSRRGLNVRILSLLTTPHQVQNTDGVHFLAGRLRWAGADVRIYTPTDAQAKAAGVIALMHAKMIVADGGEQGYLGTANVSRAGMTSGLEVGVIVRRSLGKQLYGLSDWAFRRHHRWEVPIRVPGPKCMQ